MTILQQADGRLRLLPRRDPQLSRPMAATSFTIKKAGTAELEDLLSLARITFYDAFAAANTEENIRHYIEHAFSKTKIETELLHPQSSFYMLMADGIPAGYLKVNFGAAQTEMTAPGGMEIERIYVHQQFQGIGGGKRLFDKALELAREAKLQYIWLGVWEHNHKAIAFYQKIGFKPFDKHVFRLGDDDQTDILMKVTL